MDFEAVFLLKIKAKVILIRIYILILNSLTIQDRGTEWHLNFISVALFTFSSVYYSMIYFSAFLTEDFIDLCI